MPTRKRSTDPGSQPAGKKAAAARGSTSAKKAAVAADEARAAASRAALPTKGDDASEVQIAKLEVALEERSREREDLASRLSSTEQKFDALQSSQAATLEELGRLREVAARVDTVTQDRTALQERLEGLQKELPQRIQNEVESRLKEVTSAHAAELSALQQDRDRLAARVTELETPRLDTAPSMSTSALATHFADVLASVAEMPPASADLPYAVSVTSFNVSAKGVLRATSSGEVELVTPDPGAVPAEALSTVNLDLKLLPRVGRAPRAT